MKQVTVSLLATLTAISLATMEAPDGIADTIATAASRVSLTKLDAIHLTGVEDILFSNDDLKNTDAKFSMSMCVFHAVGNYEVTLVSQNRTFNTANAGNSIPYRVTWTGIEENSHKSVTRSSRTAKMDCSGGDNAMLDVRYDSDDFKRAPAGMYSDILTILLAPE